MEQLRGRALLCPGPARGCLQTPMVVARPEPQSLTHGHLVRDAYTGTCFPHSKGLREREGGSGQPRMVHFTALTTPQRV